MRTANQASSAFPDPAAAVSSSFESASLPAAFSPDVAVSPRKPRLELEEREDEVDEKDVERGPDDGGGDAGGDGHAGGLGAHPGVIRDECDPEGAGQDLREEPARAAVEELAGEFAGNAPRSSFLMVFWRWVWRLLKARMSLGYVA